MKLTPHGVLLLFNTELCARVFISTTKIYVTELNLIHTNLQTTLYLPSSSEISDNTLFSDTIREISCQLQKWAKLNCWKLFTKDNNLPFVPNSRDWTPASTSFTSDSIMQSWCQQRENLEFFFFFFNERGHVLWDRIKPMMHLMIIICCCEKNKLCPFWSIRREGTNELAHNHVHHLARGSNIKSIFDSLTDTLKCTF